MDNLKDKLSNEEQNKPLQQPLVSGSLPTDVVEILIRAKAFVPLYMPTQAHNKHNMLGLDIIKILEKYKIDWKTKHEELAEDIWSQ